MILAASRQALELTKEALIGAVGSLGLKGVNLLRAGIRQAGKHPALAGLPLLAGLTAGEVGGSIGAAHRAFQARRAAALSTPHYDIFT